MPEETGKEPLIENAGHGPGKATVHANITASRFDGMFRAKCDALGTTKPERCLAVVGR